MFLFLMLCLAPPPPSTAMAVHAHGTVTPAQVEARGGPALYEARKALYDLQVRIAQDVAFDHEAERIAQSKGREPRAWVHEELAKRTQEPGTEDLQRLVPELRQARVLPDDPKEAQTRLLAVARDRARSRAFESFRTELLQAARFRVALEPPRMDIPNRAHAPAEGASAPVTLTVFSDFQCDACRSLHATLKALSARHPKDVRIVHRHLPLDTHPLARRAAALSLSLPGEVQGLRDLLFAVGGDVSHPSLSAWRDRPDRHPDTVVQTWIDEDLQDAARLGLDATPALFVNGRLIPGAVPLDLLERMVEEELAWATARTTVSAAAPTKP